MKNLQKGIAAPAIIAILAILAILAGTYYYNEKAKSKVGGNEFEITIPLSPLNNSGQAGTAKISEEDGFVKVVIKISVPETDCESDATSTDCIDQPEVVQPADIHVGSCSELGEEKYTLIGLTGGESKTELETTIAELANELPLAISVSGSSDEAVVVSCGDITDKKVQQLLKKLEAKKNVEGQSELEEEIEDSTGIDDLESDIKELSKDRKDVLEGLEGLTDDEPEEVREISSYKGAVLAGVTSVMLDFDKTDYDKAIKSGKIVLLYFYDKNSALGRDEVRRAYLAFDDLESDDVIGFRVNYNDVDTDRFEKDLAKKYGISTDGMKVIIKESKQVGPNYIETWSKERFLIEINNLI